MKYWIIAVLILFSGCEYGEDNYFDASGLDNWQARESIVIPEETKSLAMNISDFAAMRYEVCHDFKFISDTEKFGVKDHWETYNEILSGMTGDCEEICNLIYISALLRGYPSDQLAGVVFLRTLSDGTTDYHAALCVFSPNHAKILYVVEKSRIFELSNKENYTPLWAYTLDARWKL